MEWREADGLRWLEADLGDGARAAFSSRQGGVSEGPYEGLNLGVLTGDDPGAVVENRTHLAAALGLDPARVVMSRQIHQAGVMIHTAPQDPAHFAVPGVEPPPEGDGHVTAEEDLALLVLVADCLPIALAGEGGVAMLHGGWRGLAGGIVAAGAQPILAKRAAVGPGIGPCCFEVGDDVITFFSPLGPDLISSRHVDLPAVARTLLERAGVEQVEVTPECTRCNPELFYSHRGQGPETGRQAGVAWRS